MQKPEQRIYTYRTYILLFPFLQFLSSCSPRLIQNILKGAESVDLANVRSAYDELMIEEATEKSDYNKSCATETENSWLASMNTVSIGGISILTVRRTPSTDR